MSTDTTIKGMVLYCDGGARPNPGLGGYGIHGYLYAAQPMSKGVGRNFEITSKGYVDKAEKDTIKVLKEEDRTPYLDDGELIFVSPLLYVDITGSVDGVSTNNTCEIIAMTKAFHYVLSHPDHGVQYLQINTDSEYTKNGVLTWIDSWLKNNWIKSDGNPVANQDLWKALQEARDAIRAKGIKLTVEWVRGHGGETGNERADMLASMGVFDGRRGVIGETIEESDADTYWKNLSQRHPFIAHKRCYFSSQSTHVPGVYHLGDHGKDDELLGKRASDGCYSVVQLAEPDEVLELVRKHQSGLSGGTDSIFAMYLDQIYGADMYKAIDLFGEKGLEPPQGYRLDLKHANKTPISREFKPARLAGRAIEELVGLQDTLEKFKQCSPDIHINEITEYFYDLTEKKIPPKKGQSEGTVEIATKLKPGIIVGLADITVKARLPFEGVDAPLEDLKLSMGIDVLDRNSLKRLETMNPKVFVVTWSVSDTAYRYATIIQAGGSAGIWCGVYSNLRIVQKKSETTDAIKA